MKLRNKKTGEIGKIILKHLPEDNQLEVITDNKLYVVKTLAELNAEWEDYKEPKEYWYYDTTKNGVDIITHLEDKEKDQAIGNYFETKEEAEKAVEKLKAWKRLKDKGFRFVGIYDDYTIKFTAPNEEIGWFWCNGMGKDLDLLFGGEK